MTGVLDARGPAGMGGQRAVVTGAARGIGAQIALELARAGAEVTVFDRRDPSETVWAIQAEGGQAQGECLDVTDYATVAAAIGSMPALDALVTSAAVYGDTVSVDDLSESEVDQVLDVNVKGTLWTIKAALPLLRHGGGQVVCLGSVAGKVGGVLAGPHYVASKGAVHALVKWIAKTEATNGVRANGIAPGVIDTEMVAGRGYDPGYCPLGRLARPEEIARVAAFLASPASSYMTGTVVDVNGGYAMG